jgi:hypothetical protein
MANEMISINGTRYRVERTDRRGQERPHIRLLGSRGAVYHAIRQLKNPDRLFLIRAADSPHGYLDNPLGPVWLIDHGDRLSVQR